MSARRSVTRQDVAERAGVSGAAVSVVLNGARGNIRISEHTRARIIQAARELNYKANRSAQTLRRQELRTLGMIVQPARRVAYHQAIQYELTYHIRATAWKLGYEIIEIAEYDAESADRNPVRLLANTQLAGLLVVSDHHNVDELAALVDGGLPVVQMLRPQPGLQSAAVVVDPRAGILEAVSHLVDLGHQRIAYIGASSRHVTDRGRLDAFLDATAHNSVKVPKKYVFLDSYSVSAGATALTRFLDLREPPTAVFAAADVLALGVLRAAYARRIRIPDDFSVISYDDVLADAVAPALSSVSQPLHAVAESAVHMLVTSLEPRDNTDVLTIALPTTFTIRESTGPVTPY